MRRAEDKSAAASHRRVVTDALHESRSRLLLAIEDIAYRVPGVAIARAEFRGEVPGLVTVEAYGAYLPAVPDFASHPGAPGHFSGAPQRDMERRDLTADEKKDLMNKIAESVPEDVVFLVVP